MSVIGDSAGRLKWESSSGGNEGVIGVVDGDFRRTYVEMGKFAWSSVEEPP